MLDSKNHFIRNIDCDTFFQNNRPILFTGEIDIMIKYWNNCLQYFNITEEIQRPKSNKLLTRTPFVLHKKTVQEMMKYIKDREGYTSFYTFFDNNINKYTEFFLYTAFVLYRKYKYHTQPQILISIIDYDPSIYTWNSWNNKKKVLDNSYFKIFGLHRRSISLLDDEYKKNLITMYNLFYSKDIVEFIKNKILFT